jgi:hypothetical protein
MKKLFYAAVLILLYGTVIFAQENGETEKAAPNIPGIPGEVKLPIGILNIRGMALTGFRARSLSQEGTANLGQSTDVSGNWQVDAINPIWAENRLDLHLDYSFLNYGVFSTIRWQSWAPNSIDDNIMPDLRYAFVYGKFLKDKIKVSLGKLTDEIYAMPETRIWKTEGPWDMFNFTEDAKDDEPMSLRVEVKPIPQLNVGFQYFFVRPDGTGMWDKYWNENFADSDVWKEIGIAAEWKSDPFNAVIGVRFDSKGDPLNKYEGYTYLRGYYGDSDYLGSAAARIAGPRYKHADDVIGKMNVGLKPWVDPTDPTAWYDPANLDISFAPDPGFDGAARVFFGFNVKAIENLDLIAQAGFYNIAEWDKFGYARMNELVRYNNMGIKGLGLGLIMSQEFYGNDVFYTGESVQNPYTFQWEAVKMINSPFLTFAPEVSYKLYDVPGFQLKGALTGTFGVCVDVVDAYIKVKPAINMMMGAFLVDLFYEVEYIKYTDKALDRSADPLKPQIMQQFGLALMMIF